MTARRPFPSDPASVAQARRFAVESAGPAPPELRDRLALLVSELATNCVRHAGTEFQLSVQRSVGLIRVEVADAGGGHPSVGSPAPDGPAGRGLRIVERLSHAWGVRPASPAPGKTVWFTLAAGGEGEASQLGR